MNRLKVGLLLGVVLLCSGFALAVTTSIARNIPFFTSSLAYDATTGGQAGGQVRYYVAGGTLLVGDVVYFSAANTVNKSATLANYNAIAGVVVGGTSLGSGVASVAAADVGTTAATVGQTVYVLKQGRTWVANDANATLSAGALIQPSVTTAGKVVVQASPIDSLYRNIGRVPIGGSASTTVLADINIK
jgi:hypothetical protein